MDKSGLAYVAVKLITVVISGLSYRLILYARSITARRPRRIFAKTTFKCLCEERERERGGGGAAVAGSSKQEQAGRKQERPKHWHFWRPPPSLKPLS